MRLRRLTCTSRGPANRALERHAWPVGTFAANKRACVQVCIYGNWLDPNGRVVYSLLSW